jgi:hypothetical protein
MKGRQKYVRKIAVVLLIAVLLPNFAFAQEAAPQTPTPIADAARKAACDAAQARAVEDAKHVGGLGAGVPWGFCLGLLGMAIAVATVESPEPPPSALANQDKDYTTCYTDRYRDAAKSKKKHNRLVGALIGSAMFIGIWVAAGGSLGA